MHAATNQESGSQAGPASSLQPFSWGQDPAYPAAVKRKSLVTEAVYRLKEPRLLAEDTPARSTTNADDDASIRGIAPKKDDKWNPFIPPSSTFSSKVKATESNEGILQDENADQLLLRLSNEFSPVIEDEWDTVIYIGPPPQLHNQDAHEYEYIKQHFSKPHLMNSQKLKNLGSSQFQKFLGPMSARAERRLKKLGVHRSLPDDSQAKFYIDLRPMQDDDEALLMITELTCTPGVLSWHLSHLASGVPRTLICGKDDLNVTSKPLSHRWIELNDPVDDSEDDEKMRLDKTDGGTSAANILDLEPEYSAIRHYMAIERLLHAIAGHNPKLNSAAKMWTYFSIAKFFDCASCAQINGWIFEWLFTGNNSNFIQANPEVSYRIALGMRSPDILRTTFAMLVGERALMQAETMNIDTAAFTPGTRQTSAHGRTITILDDDEVNRIDHAAHSLTRRMTTMFLTLADNPLAWASQCPEMIKFNYLETLCTDKDLVSKPFELLQEYVRGEFYQALSQNVQEGDLMRLYRTKGYRQFGWLKRSQSFADAYNAMPLPQRLLTQSFWSQLENYSLYQEASRMMAWTQSHSLRGLSYLAPDFDSEITCVTKTALCHELNLMNDKLEENPNQKFLSHESLRKLNHEIAGEALAAAQIAFQESTEAHGLSATREDYELARAMQGLGFMSGHEIPPPSEEGYGDPFRYKKLVEKHCASLPHEVKPAVLLAQLSMKMRKMIMDEVLTPGYVHDQIGIESEISISQMDILLCLNDDEWKYLPLWAGGFDDGSGGVFAELDVPDMEQVEGFRGGKLGLGDVPGGEGSIRAGFSEVDSSDDFDEVMTDEGVSTVGRASRIATDGTTSAGASTVMSLDE